MFLTHETLPESSPALEVAPSQVYIQQLAVTQSQVIDPPGLWFSELKDGASRPHPKVGVVVVGFL